MTIKVTVPNTSNDSLTFGSANTPTAAQVVGIDSGSSNGQLAFNTTASGTSTERVRIDASGNVGIGTSSPSTYANGQAPVLVTGTGNNFATIQGRTDGPSGSTNGVSYGGSYSTNPINGSRVTFNAEGGSGQRGSISFWTKPTDDNTNQPTERARIDSSGNLLVGTTSTTVNPGISLQPSGRLNIGRSNDDAVAEFYRSGTRVGQINVTTTATSYNTSSDYRLKEAIAPMTGALAKVALLKPCTYKWKVGGSDGQGFIAHELAEVEAGCVTGEKDAVDAEGNPQYQGIDTSFLVATLTAAIQEQQALITTLTERITALEAN